MSCVHSTVLYCRSEQVPYKYLGFLLDNVCGLTVCISVAMLVQPVHAGDTRDAGEGGVRASNVPGPTIQDGGADSVSLHSCTGTALLKIAVVECTEHNVRFFIVAAMFWKRIVSRWVVVVHVRWDSG